MVLECLKLVRPHGEPTEPYPAKDQLLNMFERPFSTGDVDAHVDLCAGFSIRLAHLRSGDQRPGQRTRPDAESARRLP